MAPTDSGRPVTAAELRRFAFTVGGLLLALAAIDRWRGRETGVAILGGAGALLVAAGVVAPKALRPVYTAWMRLGHGMSRITTPIFLGLVYFIVILPTGLVMRLVGRPSLAPRARGVTGWVERPPDERRSNLRHQY